MSDEINTNDAVEQADTKAPLVERLVSFDTNDVLKVAQAVVDSGVYWDAYDSNTWDGYECNHCNAGRQDLARGNAHKFEHNLDCPVLIANDLLTGS